MREKQNVNHKRELDFGQLGLVILLTSLVAILFLPIPSFGLDLLLSLNILGALTILVLTISVNDAMKIYSFPSILLIGTIFRLSINISSTKSILTNGSAGKIIKTFGETVSNNNLAVGCITFLILLIIQFIIISKGSERVAEVAARFTLDALPGKQMSIDADLRAGLICNEEAKKMRAHLIKESKFFGSMDGAMKFIKGETIAGFIITAINICGGLLIGYAQKGMTLKAAAKQYTLLTIGDGLSSQIPALLLSLSAGFIITRVQDLDGKESLGSEITKQILQNTKALFTVSGIFIVTAFAPGFPSVIFISLGVLVALIAFILFIKEKIESSNSESIQKYKANTQTQNHINGSVTPFILELSQSLYQQFLEDSKWQICFNNLFPKVKTALEKQIGIPFPDLQIEVNENLNNLNYVIKIFDIPVDKGFLSPNHLMLRKHLPDNVIPLNSNEKSTETVHGTPVTLFEIQRQKELQDKGLKAYKPEEILLKHVSLTLKKHAKDFVGIQEIKNILEKFENKHGELVREVIPRKITIQKFTEVLKRLVEEDISIKDFRSILEILAGCEPEKKSTVDLTEEIRMELKRYISYKYAKDGIVTAFLLDPEIETEISNHISHNENGSFLTLHPKRIEQIQEVIQNVFNLHNINPKKIIILTSPEVRRYFKKILESLYQETAVLSFQELESHIKIKQLDVLSLNYPEINNINK